MLILTERCNLRCSYCYARAGGRGADMTPETAFTALDRLGSGPGTVTVELTGGEPLLNFDLVREVVTQGRAPGRRFALQTNGLALDREKLTFLREQGVALGISLDGPPEVNRLTRGDDRGAFAALRLLEEFRLGVNLTVVLTRHNLEHLPRFLLTLAGFQCLRVVNLDLVRPVGRAGDQDLAPEPAQIRRMVPGMLEALEFIAQRRFPPLKVREVDQVRRRQGLGVCEPYCLAAAGSYAAVTPRGQVYPCASLVDRPEYLAGTLAGSLDQDGPPELATLVTGWGLPDGCRDCEVRFVCRGGCPSRRISAAGGAGRPYALECSLRREIFGRMMK